MKLFESEGWKSFRLNSLAVILGVVITFGGGRLITNCQKRQDAREIVGLFKFSSLWRPSHWPAAQRKAWSTPP